MYPDEEIPSDVYIDDRFDALDPIDPIDEYFSATCTIPVSY